MTVLSSTILIIMIIIIVLLYFSLLKAFYQAYTCWLLVTLSFALSKVFECNWRFYVTIKLSYLVLRVCGRLIYFLSFMGGKMGIYLPIELFNGKSLGNKSSITNSSIILYSPIIIMGNIFDIFTLCQLVWVIYRIALCPYPIKFP